MAATRAGEATSTATTRRRKGWLGGITPSSRLYPIRQLLQNKVAIASALFLLLMVVLAILAPVLTPYDATTVDPVGRLQGPTSDHWLGTDDLGRDVLTRALYGARVSLLVGLSVMALAAVFGAIIGLAAAYYSRLDTLLMRFMDGLLAFPSILLAIAIMASLGPSTVNVIVALAVVYTAPISRVVRGAALVTKQMQYVESARTIGARDLLILRRYIFANSLSPLIVQSTFVVAFAIISEASLSYLGAGVPPETPTWGNMLREGQRLIGRAWWLSVLPGALLVLTVLTLNLLGDSLRDALDPRSRER